MRNTAGSSEVISSQEAEGDSTEEETDPTLRWPHRDPGRKET